MLSNGLALAETRARSSLALCAGAAMIFLIAKELQSLGCRGWVLELEYPVPTV